MKDPFSPDLAEQKVQPRALLERDIQKACVDWARSQGCWARKFSSPANRSVPDYIFSKLFHGHTQIWAVEFKAPGKGSTATQIEEQTLMRKAGWAVYEVDSVGTFKKLFHWIAFARP